AIEHTDMVFGIGPAGTGKTYLAVAMAVSALVNKQVNRIVLARPAVEAGERLGFLPGTLQEKVDPYLRPLYDALYDLLEAEKVDRFLEKNVIEIAPIAFMRGRTLNDSFIILDEAQNTTSEQMKMFLTRMGFNSKCVITGDITQIDLPNNKRSGLVEAAEVLGEVKSIGGDVAGGGPFCAPHTAADWPARRNRHPAYIECCGSPVEPAVSKKRQDHRCAFISRSERRDGRRHCHCVAGGGSPGSPLWTRAAGRSKVAGVTWAASSGGLRP